MKLNVERSLDDLYHNGFISSDELGDAMRAQGYGSEYHTIGYEVEALPSAQADIAKVRDITTDVKLRSHRMAEYELNQYDYGVGSDGLYELQSPPADHPLALIVATRGLARMGWLPGDNGTNGRVTSHVSIGTPVDVSNLVKSSSDYGIDFLQDTALLLRNIEMIGGTTASRLAGPLRQANINRSPTAQYSWNQKGEYGFLADSIPPFRSFDDLWVGTNDRIEFRTLSYYNPHQFSTMLNAVYYLTRGFLDINEPGANDVYLDHNEWMKNYCEDNDLPIDIYMPAGGENVYTDELVEYLEPYVQHLLAGDLEAVRSRTNQTVHDIREELGMSDIPFDTNPSA